MGELTVCGATEDGACYFSQQIDSLQTDVNRLTAERDALLADRDEWHRVATGQLQTIDQLRAEIESVHATNRLLAEQNRVYSAEVERLKAEIAKDADVMRVCEALLSYNGGEAALLEQLRELREAASEICEYEPLSDSDHGYVRAWECLQALLAKGGS